MILAFCLEAGSVCISIVLSALLAILIDPVMVFLERAGLGRTLAATISVLSLVLVLAAVSYGLYAKADAFAGKLPTYGYRIQKALRPLTRKIQNLEQGAETLTPGNEYDGSTPKAVMVKQPVNWTALLFRGVGSISGFLLIAAIAPFLTFFMLIRKERMYNHFKILSDGRIDAERLTRGVQRMVRGYVVGNLVVALGLSAAIIIGFLFIGLHAAVPLGFFCGFLNVVPFVGGLIAALVAMAAALLQFSSIEPFIVIAVLILGLHLIALNYVFPRVVGPRLLIGPVATTVGMLFWGWLWGVMGLLLAVPLTAFLKLLGDSYPGLGWLSEILAQGPEPAPSFVPFSAHTVHKLEHYFKHLYLKHWKHEH